MTDKPWSGQIRPLRAGEVAAPLQRVFDGMSARSRYLRYHTEMPRLTAAYRAALTTVDGLRHVVLVAERPGPDGPIAEGLGRLIAMDGGGAEIAIEVVDAAQGQGIGGRLLRGLVAIAEAMDHRWLMAAVVSVHTQMLDWLRREFPASTVRVDGTMTVVTIPLP
jgi:GNAT superfamily N-acetyltransferase